MTDTPLGPGREFDLIRGALRTQGSLPGYVTVGPGDDAAVVSGSDPVVLSTDLTIEDVHFRSAWVTPAEVGYRATAAALSDLAAMAATPVGALVSIGVPVDRADDWVEDATRGAGFALAEAGGVLLGGDLSRVGDGAPVVIDVVAVGRATAPIRRRGANPTDEIWVTGYLGSSALAVREWEAGREPPPTARQRFAKPTARIREAQWLRDHLAPTAMIDVSDGLGSDAGHLAAASGVRLVIDAARLPVEPEVAKYAGTDDLITIALAGGEDYELCFSAPAGAGDRVRQAFQAEFDLPMTRVGEVTTGAGVGIVGVDLPGPDAGHDHFRRP